jgi:predicted ATPase/DNA-binding SARP family transcriptional activator
VSVGELWRIELLGGLRAVQPDRVVTRFRSRKTGALLAYLAFYCHRAHAREHLIETLWPEAELDWARDRLRVGLSSLRRQLEPPGVTSGGVLVASRLAVQLNPAAVTTDVAHFEAALQSAAQAATSTGRALWLSAAVDHYQGPLLPGYFEAWILPEQQRLAGRFFLAAHQLVQHLEQVGDLSRALDYAGRAVAVDPLREEAQRELIRLLAVAGQPSSALEQYRQLAQLLGEQLGETPSPATQQLVAAIERQRGVYRPRDGVAPERRFQVNDPVGPRPESPPREAGAGYSVHLPLQLTRFFGRQRELGALRELLLGPGRRLITLAGPGGSGKTRLAIEAAGQALEAWQGSVWFVPLADLRDAEGIIDGIRDGLCLPRESPEAALEQVVEHLSRQPSLLVLDNFEQLVDQGAALVRMLLERVPLLKCLVTSRQRLDLGGEVLFDVPPLATPSGALSPEQLTLYASVQLFVDRAQAVQPDFQVTNQNAPAVAEICHQLEGLPLAIELAAARVKLLSPQQMLAQLQRRLDFLVSRRRDLHSRHQTLRATLDWSYQLLSPELQRFFIHLSVFRGGFTWEAAGAVAAVPGQVLDYLEQLQNNSLVLAESGPDETRFRLLEMLREYGAEQLSPEEAAIVAGRHARFYMALAEASEKDLGGTSRQAEWLSRLEADLDNIRAALAWCLAAGEAEIGMRLGGTLRHFWYLRGYRREGREHLQRLLALPAAAAPTAARAKGLLAVSYLAVDRRATRPLLEESLAISRGRGDRLGEAVVLLNLGNLASHNADYPLARSYYEETLAIGRELGHLGLMAGTLGCLARVAEMLEEVQTAQALWTESERLWQEYRGSAGGGELMRQGDQARQRGDHDAAWALYEKGLALIRESGVRPHIGEALQNMACFAIEQHDTVRAHKLLAESRTYWREAGGEIGQAMMLEAFASLAEAQGRVDAAARLLGTATALRDAIAYPPRPHQRAERDRIVAAIRRERNEAAFNTLWNEGRAMLAERALDYGQEATS